MLTGSQIRAARALLGWEAAELAEKAGLARQSISHLETGASKPRAGSIERIETALAGAGIEFIGDTGVNLRANYRLLKGHDCYLQLLGEVYTTLHRKRGAEVLSICTDDSLSPPEVVAAIQRWHDAKIRCRFLSHENAKRFDFPLEEYHVIPARLFTNSVMVVFGDKVATLLREGSQNSGVTIVRDRNQADMLRGLFEIIWAHTAPAKARR